MWLSGVDDGEPGSEKLLMLTKLIYEVYLKIDTVIEEEYDAAGEESQIIRKTM